MHATTIPFPLPLRNSSPISCMLACRLGSWWGAWGCTR
jgi:hypothetical protein